MKLIDDIIASVTETKEPISDTLRRCLVLADKLKNNTLKTWVERELNGYAFSDDVPSYRLRIPIYPARDSDLDPATCSDLIPATCTDRKSARWVTSLQQVTCFIP
ncbi:MAG TPA: hypothetical protein VD978_27210 [Azospirillum sp.]|nr:hypothetical protein [Azospirillum sp.]